LIFIRKLFLADERQIAWRNLFFLTGKDSIRLATSKAVFRQDIEKIKYYASTQHSMEAFAATFVALAFLGTIRRWFSCNDPDSEKSLAILWLILGGLMLIATWIALDVFLRRGRAFQEIANEQSGKKILPP
jgi:hypothetical protein